MFIDNVFYKAMLNNLKPPLISLDELYVVVWTKTMDLNYQMLNMLNQL